MILRQFLHVDPVIAASYIVGCGGKATCVVVDPVDEPEVYVRRASELGMAIRFVVDTHVHADHLSTGRSLAAAVDAPYLLHESVHAGFDFEGVADGAHLEIGNVAVDVLHLPGHTPEHIGLLVADRTRGPEPWLGSSITLIASPLPAARCDGCQPPRLHQLTPMRRHLSSP